MSLRVISVATFSTREPFQISGWCEGGRVTGFMQSSNWSSLRTVINGPLTRLSCRGRIPRCTDFSLPQYIVVVLCLQHKQPGLFRLSTLRS